MKCIVNGCENHPGEGIGHRLHYATGNTLWICFPCMEYITRIEDVQRTLRTAWKDQRVPAASPPWEFEWEA